MRGDSLSLPCLDSPQHQSLPHTYTPAGPFSINTYQTLETTIISGLDKLSFRLNMVHAKSYIVKVFHVHGVQIVLDLTTGILKVQL